MHGQNHIKLKMKYVTDFVPGDEERIKDREE